MPEARFLDAVSVARFGLRAGRDVRNIDDATKLTNAMRKCLANADVLGGVLVKIVTRRIGLRFVSGATQPLESITADVLTSGLEDDEGEHLRKAKGTILAMHELATDARPMYHPTLLQTACAYLCQVGGWQDEADAFLREAISTYEAEIDDCIMRLVEMSPPYKFTEDYLREPDMTWRYVNVVRRLEVDWWTGDIVQLDEQIPTWKAQINGLP